MIIMYVPFMFHNNNMRSKFKRYLNFARFKGMQHVYVYGLREPTYNIIWSVPVIIYLINQYVSIYN